MKGLHTHSKINKAKAARNGMFGQFPVFLSSFVKVQSPFAKAVNTSYEAQPRTARVINVSNNVANGVMQLRIPLIFESLGINISRISSNVNPAPIPPYSRSQNAGLPVHHSDRNTPPIITIGMYTILCTKVAISKDFFRFNNAFQNPMLVPQTRQFLCGIFQIWLCVACNSFPAIRCGK